MHLTAVLELERDSVENRLQIILKAVHLCVGKYINMVVIKIQERSSDILKLEDISIVKIRLWFKHVIEINYSSLIFTVRAFN
jgi:hypothetical protein